MDLQDADGIDSDKFVIFQQDDLHIESFPLMKEIRRQGKLCDVTLKVRDFWNFVDFLYKCVDVMGYKIDIILISSAILGGRPIIFCPSNCLGCYYSVFLCHVHA